MEEITGRIAGQLTITHDIILRGTVQGDAWVTGGAALTLYGLVAGDLHVDEGGCAIVNVAPSAGPSSTRVGAFRCSERWAK
jgi:hypothetical protein